MNRIADLLNRTRAAVRGRKMMRSPIVPTDDRKVQWDRSRFRIIAEIKRASLSAGFIRPDLDLASLARSYQEQGASAISVLTEEHSFKGSLDDLRTVRASVSVPILQKDFVLDEFQILEAKEAGADFVLLIARFLTPEQIRNMHQLCEQIGINAIVEVTDEQDLRKVEVPVRYLGVNSRDLETLQVDPSRFERMRKHLPDSYWIAESGINSIEALRQVVALGYHGALIGEHLLRAENPSHELHRFIRSVSQPNVKICGITNERDAGTAVELGASALGFIFAESPRRISPQQLRSFRKQIPVPCVGVFRCNPQHEIDSIVEECELDIAQIYDSASASIPIWKAQTTTSLDEIKGRDWMKDCLIDLKLPEEELPHAWKILGEKGVFALAGGLHPGNVSVAMTLCHPEWIDVARGVESKPGVKDAMKMREFIRKVKVNETS